MRKAIKILILATMLSSTASYAQTQELWVLDDKCLDKIASNICKGSSPPKAITGPLTGDGQAFQYCLALARYYATAEKCYRQAPLREDMTKFLSEFKSLQTTTNSQISNAVAAGVQNVLDKYAKEFTELTKELDQARADLRKAQEALKAAKQ